MGLPVRYPVVPIRTPYNPPFPQMGVLTVPPYTCIPNCGQTASVSGMFTMDSLLGLTNALSNGAIADPLWKTVHPKFVPPPNLHGALRPNCISGMVTINRLYMLISDLSDATIADSPLPPKLG